MSSQPAFAPYAHDPAAAQPSSQPAPARARKQLNMPALFAAITAILLVSPVAIVLGHIGLVQVRRRGQSGLFLAIVGLVLGYLGFVATIAALVALVVFVNSGPTPPTTF